jgi:hypothetical protein
MASGIDRSTVPNAKEIAAALGALGTKSTSKWIGATVDELVSQGEIRPEVASMTKAAVVYAKDRIRGIGSGVQLSAGSKPLDEQYFEGNKEELRGARASSRNINRQEFEDSVPAELRRPIQEFFRSSEGREHVTAALKQRMKSGKAPANERVKSMVKEAVLDEKFAGKARRRGRVPQETAERAPLSPIGRLVTVGGRRSKLEEMASRTAPEVERLPGRAPDNRLDKLRNMANDKALNRKTRLQARALYTRLAEKQNREMAGYGKAAQAKAEERALGSTAESDISERSMMGAAREVDEKSQIEFGRTKSPSQIAKDEETRVQQLVGQMGRGRGFNADKKRAFNKAYMEVSQANPEFSKAKVNRIALMKVVPEYASYLKRNLSAIKSVRKIPGSK